MRIALAADHAGYLLKDELVRWLREQGHDVTDLGTNGPESVDYPEYGRRLAQAVASGAAERGIAVCGSGIGISIAVNSSCALIWLVSPSAKPRPTGSPPKIMSPLDSNLAVTKNSAKPS
jgi:RpiB/LacA/LacB family sugar-phosphate isomerase